MTYRALFTADVHAGNNLPWAVKDPNTLITDRLLDVMDSLRQVTTYALEQGISDIWILGDLIDKRLVDAVTLKLVTEELSSITRLGLTIRLVPGNHEAGDAACRHFTVDAYQSLGIWVASQQEVLPGRQGGIIDVMPGFTVLAIPYLPQARITETIRNIIAAIDGGEPDIQLCLLHQTIKGGRVGEWVCPEGLDPAELERFHNTLSGHFHTPQSVSDKVMYLGAPIQHAFGDRGDVRGFWDISFPDHGPMSGVMIPITDSPLFHECEWKTEDDPPIIAGISAKAYANIKVIGTEASVNKLWKTAEDWAQKLKSETGARMIKLTRKTDTAPSKNRIAFAATERPTWDTLLSRYLDTTDCAGLDRDKLEQLGKELMASVDQ